MGLGYIVIFFQKWFQMFRPFKIRYSQKRGFHQNVSLPESIISTVLDLNLALFFVASVLGIKQFLTTKPEKNNADLQAVKKFVLTGVLQLLFLGCNLACLSAAWTIRYRYQETIWMLNEAHKLNKRRMENESGLSKKIEVNIIIFNLVTWSTFLATIMGCTTLSLTPLVYNGTPAHGILGIFWNFPIDSI